MAKSGNRKMDENRLLLVDTDEGLRSSKVKLEGMGFSVMQATESHLGARLAELEPFGGVVIDASTASPERAVRIMKVFHEKNPQGLVIYQQDEPSAPEDFPAQKAELDKSGAPYHLVFKQRNNYSDQIRYAKDNPTEPRLPKEYLPLPDVDVDEAKGQAGEQERKQQ